MNKSMKLPKEVLEELKKLPHEQYQRVKTEIEMGLRRVFKEKNIRFYCVTCNTVFVDMNYLDYAQLHSRDSRNPDMCFLEAVKHFIHNKEHLIFIERPNALGKPELIHYTPEIRDCYTKKILLYPNEKSLLRDVKWYIENSRAQI